MKCGHCIAGLPPHGLLVLMPTSMHLTASSSWPPTSLTVALSLQALAVQVSPAAAASLHTLSKILQTSAVLSGQQSDAEDHAQLHHHHEHTGIGPAQTHTRMQGHASSSTREAASHGHVPVGSEASGFDSQPVSAAAETVHDDLRCGFFGMASAPTSCPGEQRP